MDCCNFYGNKRIKDYIYKCKSKKYKQGFNYRFSFREDGKYLVDKRSIDYDYLLLFEINFFKENKIEF